ncbi:MAG: DNA methylase, partial [Actinomycetota bacterium]|nr:DNA methylase [Actinomycetota bacterium]
MAEPDAVALEALLAEVQIPDIELCRHVEFIANIWSRGQTDPAEVPDSPAEPITQPGDLWILGDHRLLCGDAGSVVDLDRLPDGATVDLLNTDPPYNV